MKNDLPEVLLRFGTDVLWTFLTVLFVPVGALIGAVVGTIEAYHTIKEIWSDKFYFNDNKDWNSFD